MGKTRQLWLSRSCLKITSIHSCLPITTSRAFKSSFSIKSTKEELSRVICFILFPDTVHLKGGTTLVPGRLWAHRWGFPNSSAWAPAVGSQGRTAARRTTVQHQQHWWCDGTGILTHLWMSKAEDTESTPVTKRGKASACTKSLKCWVSLSLQQILAVLWWKKSSLYFQLLGFPTMASALYLFPNQMNFNLADQTCSALSSQFLAILGRL